jgi:hydroxymethylglutaryl-CoA synthase
MRYLAYDGAGRQAIVVAADIAEYDRGSTGEPTQGAGAVAMLVDRDPQLLALDLHTSGSSSNYRIADFRKPFLRFNGQTPGANGRLRDFPVFNGKYSTACYLDEVICAFDALFQRRQGKRAAFLRSLSGVFMHRPYHHMPVSAWTMAYLFAMGADGGEEHEELEGYCKAAAVELKQVLAEMGQRPSLFDKVVSGHPPEEPYPLTAQVMKTFRKSARYKEVVEGKLRLGAAAMMHMGNLYTAALPAWIAAGLEEAQAQPAELAGHKLLLVGYGSGDAAETVVAKVAANWRQTATKIGLSRALSNAVGVGRDDYARLHAAQWPQEAQIPQRAGFTIDRVGKSHDAQFHDLGIEYYRYRK